MARKTLAEVFELEPRKGSTGPILADYDIFQDKELLDLLRRRIVENLIAEKVADGPLFKEYIDREIDRTLEGYNLSNLERTHIFEMMENEIHGYGPLSELLNDESITGVMVNGPDQIYIETEGKLVRDETVSFINQEHILRTIERLIRPLGKTLDRQHPMVDGRLSDGTKIAAMIPPLSLSGPVLSIRKRKRHLEKMDELLRLGTVTPYMARFLQAAVLGKLNILICGEADSGKTTLLNALPSFVPNEERIITIEDSVELSLPGKHVVTLEACNLTHVLAEDRLDTLVSEALQMRPDRLILGELVGKEALEFLRVMNRGYRGSMTSIRARTPEDALSMWSTFIQEAQLDLPSSTIQEYFIGGIDLIVQVEKLVDGRRKVVSISEIVGLKEEQIRRKEIFAFRRKETLTGNPAGEFVLYNYLPVSYRKLKLQGIDLVDDIFAPIEAASKKKI